MIVVNTPEVVNSPQRKEQQGADKLGERREGPKTRAHGNEETVELSPECGVGVEDANKEASSGRNLGSLGTPSNQTFYFLLN